MSTITKNKSLVENSDSSVDESEFLVMGRFGKTHGIKGFLKINSYAVPEEKLLDYLPWYIERHGKWEKIELAGTQLHGHGILAQPTNSADPETARLYTGIEIAILRNKLEPLDHGQFYWTDLENLQVITIDGIDLGKVAFILETGSYDVLVIKHDTRERMIPFVWEHYIHNVDLDKKIITVDWDPEF
jgi:16S rRNA processing protein RimM